MKYLTIVMYHYVRPIKKSSYPLIKGLEMDAFRMQLSYLEKNYKIITMESLIRLAKKNISLPDNSCLLTFDDGYKDHYVHVFPELKKRNLQGSFFPTAKAVVEGTVLDVNKIHFIIAKQPNIDLITDDILDTYSKNKLIEFLNNWIRKLINTELKDLVNLNVLTILLDLIVNKTIKTKIITPPAYIIIKNNENN